MLVYGDRVRRVSPQAALAEAAGASDAETAFILAAGAAQGLVDTEFEERGEDELTPLHAAALSFVRSAARGAPDLAALAGLPLPPEIAVKEAEGYAFYALYPEGYARAARALALDAPALVIGLRSIGLGLAAVVAEALGSETAVSLRPVGPPFRRQLRASENLKRRLSAHGGSFVVVDEGPGLSGSSFGAVLDLLEELGVARERIAVIAGHAGDLGREASPAHRARWRTLRRVAADWTPDPADLFEDLTGPALAEDLSGGLWREGRPLPACPMLERRKVRLTGATGIWLARFAGLGPIGAAKLSRARALHAAGFGPEPAALRRGWLLSRWAEGEPARPDLMRLGAYLRFRAEAFPAEAGAGLEALAEMARANGRELGINVAAEPPASAGRPTHVDGRLHAWEWLRAADGRVLKLDGLDHSCGHDLIGPQDVAWDVAGAAVELELSARAAEALRRRVGADAGLTGFFRIAYPAFQAGLWRLAGEEAEVARYARALATAVDPAGSGPERRTPWPNSQTSIPATR